ncbi:MAG: hypothetical protein CMM00_16490 [Rhodopirellula sp.]|nr:hypothetical protein [Rhodopirellula sp.]
MIRLAGAELSRVATGHAALMRFSGRIGVCFLRICLQPNLRFSAECEVWQTLRRGLSLIKRPCGDVRW